MQQKGSGDALRDDDDKKSIIHASLLPLIISDRIMMMTMREQGEKERDVMLAM